MGQLGLGALDDVSEPTRVQLPAALTSTIAIAAGANHVVVAAESPSQLLAWGDATHSQQWGIVESSSLPQHVPPTLMALPLRALAAGWLFSVALDARGVLWTCGQYAPTLRIASPRALFADARVAVARVACGVGHALAIGSDGVVFGWGDNKHGQLGAQAGATLVREPSVVGEVGGARAVACGRRHSVVLTAGGAVRALGHNRYRQLPDDADVPARVVPLDDVRCLWDATVLIGARDTADGSFGVHVVGKAVFGVTLINRSTIARWRALSCGSEHLAAVDTRGTVHMYGWNEHGQLGRGDSEPLDESAVDGVVPARLAHVQARDVVCGAGFTIVVPS